MRRSMMYILSGAVCLTLGGTVEAVDNGLFRGHGASDIGYTTGQGDTFSQENKVSRNSVQGTSSTLLKVLGAGFAGAGLLLGLAGANLEDRRINYSG